MVTVEKTIAPTGHRLRRELAQLRAENKFLRERLPMSNRYSRIIATAQSDAVELVDRRFSSERTSKAALFSESGMSETRWYWAVALLRYAQVVAVGHAKAELQFNVLDRPDALTKLHNGAAELSEEGGYKRLRRMLPASRKKRKKVA